MVLHENIQNINDDYQYHCMLSYRHGFHAGNFVDVHKHITLILLLQALRQKPTPFCYIDTHAGCALYDLQSEFAQKNREYETGISRLWTLKDVPKPVANYLKAVQLVNPRYTCREDSLRFYPGSPTIARQFLRPHDHMILMELHNTEAPELKKMFQGDKQVGVHHRDGFEGLPGLVPPREKRGLVLIDPAYEIKQDFRLLTDSLIKSWQKWPTGIYMIWYPLQQKKPIPEFHYELHSAGMKKLLIHEFSVLEETRPNQLSGSGMLVVNPPWQFDETIRSLLKWLVPVLNRGSNKPVKVQWLSH